MLEMYDQAVRANPGGETAAYLRQETIPNEAFVVERLGVEADRIISGNRVTKKSKVHKILRALKPYLSLREPMVRLILGREYPLLKVGRFRNSGEIHQWMYDRYSLGKLLAEAGFSEITERSANESYLERWASFNLDTEPDSAIYKPDSFYMEGIKP